MNTFANNAPSWVAREAEILIPPRRTDIAVVKLDGEAVFCDPENDNTYHLNETSRVVWECCNGKTTVRGAADRLAARFDVDFDIALDDVEEIIELFVAFNLIITTNRP